MSDWRQSIEYDLSPGVDLCELKRRVGNVLADCGVHVASITFGTSCKSKSLWCECGGYFERIGGSEGRTGAYYTRYRRCTKCGERMKEPVPVEEMHRRNRRKK